MVCFSWVGIIGCTFIVDEMRYKKKNVPYGIEID